MSGPDVPAVDVLAPQAFDEVCVKIPALACAIVQKHFKRKIFQFAAEPRIKGHSEPMLGFMQYASRQQIAHGQFENTLPSF